ncbi:MAG TPA: hypothetical protein DCX22_02940 [Dehalococcoidia bacterium]|nr:hypothetical protein [Dehalococcoidia bacterium]
MNAIFVSDYFATPEGMKALLEEDEIKHIYYLHSKEEMTVPCAYFTKMGNKLGNPQERALLASTLAHVVRAWSESSAKIGFSPNNKDKIEEIYKRLVNKIFENPISLPYQYCLLELIKPDNSTR